MAIKGRLGMVGGGNMGSALLKGLIAKGVAAPDQVVVAELDPGRREELTAQEKVECVADPGGLGELDYLIMAVKPHQMAEALGRAACAVKPGGLVISLAAGVTIAQLSEAVAGKLPVVRAMPNTPALVGAGVTALAAGPGVSHQQMAVAREAFGAVGLVLEVEEKHMDAVTGLSGSGPAYIFIIIEALSDAGVLQGLDRAKATALAAQTVAGAAALVLQSNEHPGALKDKVTSPGGTTIAGCHVLEKGGLRGILMDAVAAATKRSRELGK